MTAELASIEMRLEMLSVALKTYGNILSEIELRLAAVEKKTK